MRSVIGTPLWCKLRPKVDIVCDVPRLPKVDRECQHYNATVRCCASGMRVGIVSCRFGSPFVPVGAGVGMRRGGDACVALVLFPRAPFLSSQGDASVPTPHPNHSRPYGDDACPLQKPTSESPSPAPTRTLCLLNNPGF